MMKGRYEKLIPMTIKIFLYLADSHTIHAWITFIWDNTPDRAVHGILPKDYLHEPVLSCPIFCKIRRIKFFRPGALMHFSAFD